MSASSTPRIVVGIDGSAEADAALHFALTEARLRGMQLLVVCAFELPDSTYVGEAFAATPDAVVEAEREAEESLRSALKRIPPDGVAVEAIAIDGHPATVLAELAADAELLVVGSRGHGAAKRLVLGSVSSELAHHTPCPLVIVPTHPDPPRRGV